MATGLLVKCAVVVYCAVSAGAPAMKKRGRDAGIRRKTMITVHDIRARLAQDKPMNPHNVPHEVYR